VKLFVRDLFSRYQRCDLRLDLRLPYDLPVTTCNFTWDLHDLRLWRRPIGLGLLEMCKSVCHSDTQLIRPTEGGFTRRNRKNEVHANTCKRNVYVCRIRLSPKRSCRPLADWRARAAAACCGCRPDNGCPGCFFLREKFHPCDIYVSGGGLPVAPINETHLSLVVCRRFSIQSVTEYKLRSWQMLPSVLYGICDLIKNFG